MIGKGALLVVFAFILAFSTFQVKMSENVLATSDNFVNNFMETLIHETSLSAMNFAINKVWDEKVKDTTFMVRANHCSSNVDIKKPGSDTVRIKVKTWGKAFDNEHNVFVSKEDSISAYFAYNMPISKYFWFTNNEGNVYWTTGDTVWGPMHTNTVVKTWGAPVFYGKVTAKSGITPNPLSKKNKAKFYGGWEVGIENELPTDMSHLINEAIAYNGGAPANTKSVYDKETVFDFQSDGSVIRTVSGLPPDTVLLTDIAKTGALISSEDIRVKGVFNGKMSMYTTKNIWIDDDIVYADNPETNPKSNDILGLVAQNDVLITDNAPNNSDCNIQACVMAVKGAYGAEKYASRPVAGVLRFTGSIVQNKRGPVGTFSWGGGIKSGFSKRYRFDARLSTISPPHYPFLKSLRLVAWWE
jgi:hypothetical protein